MNLQGPSFVLLHLILDMVHKSHSVAFVTRTDNVIVAGQSIPRCSDQAEKREDM